MLCFILCIVFKIILFLLNFDFKKMIIYYYYFNVNCSFTFQSNYIDEACGRKKSEEELILSVKPLNNIKTGWNKKVIKEA